MVMFGGNLGTERSNNLWDVRMSDDAVIILDPVNAEVIKDGLANGICTYAGGNCTAGGAGVTGMKPPAISPTCTWVLNSVTS